MSIRDTISTKMKPNACAVQLFELTQPDRVLIRCCHW